MNEALFIFTPRQAVEKIQHYGANIFLTLLITGSNL